MDPVTHGIIGLGIAALSGQPIDITNPIALGTVLGAMSPDIDIIVKYWGDYEYLKHHRGLTHSVFGIIGLSTAISAGLSLMFTEYSFFSIFIWTMLGTLSHTFFDALNSYGVRPFLPFTNKKYLASILMLYDPFITALCLGLAVVNVERTVKIATSVVLLTTYIIFRLLVKTKASRAIRKKYNISKDESNVYILPALMNFFKWDFIIDTDKQNIVGQYNFLTNKITIRKELIKEKHSLIRYAYETKLGRYFTEFTPITHVEVVEQERDTILKITDLRYIMRNNFMHHATIVFNKDTKVEKQIFHPYNYENKILVNDKQSA